MPSVSASDHIVFLFTDAPTAWIYTLSLHDALPILRQRQAGVPQMNLRQWYADGYAQDTFHLARNTTVDYGVRYERSEGHTSELQSHSDLVCRLLLETQKTE